MTKTQMSTMRNGSNGPSQKEVPEATMLKTLGDSTRISLAIAINNASKALAQRDGDELLKMAETALALAGGERQQIRLVSTSIKSDRIGSALLSTRARSRCQPHHKRG